MKQAATALATSMVLLFATGTKAQQMTLYNGKCEVGSHIAEGRATEDLTKRESRYFCDSLVMTVYNSPPRVMFQFAEKRAHHGSPLGFVGIPVEKDIYAVNHVYLEPGVQTPVDQGVCKVFWKGSRLGSLMCGAMILEGERKTVPVVVFTVTGVAGQIRP